MNIKPTYPIVFFLILVGSTVLGIDSVADPLERIDVYTGKISDSRPPEYWATASTGTYYAYVQRGKLVVSNDRFHGTVEYPLPRNGQIVAAFGRLYRLERTSGPLGSIRRYESTIQLSRLTDRKELASISLRPNSIVVPVKRESEGSVWFKIDSSASPREVTQLHLVRIEVVESGDQTAHVATIREVLPAAVGPDRKEKTQHVRVSEILALGDAEYQVRRIVAPNDKLNVVGWIELVPANRSSQD